VAEIDQVESGFVVVKVRVSERKSLNYESTPKRLLLHSTLH